MQAVGSVAIPVRLEHLGNGYHVFLALHFWNLFCFVFCELAYAIKEQRGLRFDQILLSKNVKCKSTFSVFWNNVLALCQCLSVCLLVLAIFILQ